MWGRGDLLFALLARAARTTPRNVLVNSSTKVAKRMAVDGWRRELPAFMEGEIYMLGARLEEGVACIHGGGRGRFEGCRG